MADLTRFDFNAFRFTKSFSIRQMSNEEIGQYILLLSEAWLGGKETSLPDNPDILASLARCKKISDKVLAMFPLVETETGPVRRNDTLYAEWMATQERLGLAKEYGRRGGEAKKAAFREPLGSLETPSRVPLPNTRPDQTDSYQPNPISNSFGQSTFKNIAIQYSSFFSIHHSKGKKHLERYQTACSKYGEDRVLEYFQRWAKASSWLKEKRDTNGLNFFWKPLEEMVEGDELRVARDKEEQKDEVSESELEKAMVTDRAERQKQIAEELKQAQVQREFEEANRDVI